MTGAQARRRRKAPPCSRSIARSATASASKGAKIGPNLDGVGIRGVDRLLEDILDPNRNVDQAFRTTQIVSTDGRIVTGLALREEGQVLVLADAQGKEVRVPSDEIDQRTVSQLSLMPSNVPDLVSEADFVHLIGYLLSQRVRRRRSSGAPAGTSFQVALLRR